MCILANMNRDKVLIFADHLARFYSEQYGFPPVVGRVIGYLAVCQPMEQSINDIAATLLTSRSAVNSAIKSMETMKLVRRTRPAGTRSDLVSINPIGLENSGFEPSEYIQMAALAREGLELLQDASPERRQPLEMMASLNDFLAERLPQLYEEWMTYHQQKQAAKK